MNPEFEELAQLVGQALAERWLESRQATIRRTDSLVAGSTHDAPEAAVEPSSGAADAGTTSAPSS